MNVVNGNERSCEWYRRNLDAYLDNELPAGTTRDVSEHLDFCPDCTRITEARRRAKQLLRNAVRAQAAPPELVQVLHERFSTQHRSFFGYNTARWMMAAAAVFVLAIATAGVLQWGRVISVGGEGGVLETVSARVQEILRVGLVDHVHCAILSQRWKRFVSFEEMKSNSGRSALGPEFIDLVPAIQAKVGSDLKIVEGHRCTANHRRYVHLILTGDKGAIVSLVITQKDSESFTQAEAVAVISASGIPIYRDHQGILEVAGFESDRYLAYVVSNLDRAANLKLASEMAPIVYSHLHRLEV